MSEFGDHLDEMDVEAFLNAREWLEKALVSAGAIVTDAGVGGGRADVGIMLNGAPFSVQLKPRLMRVP